MACTGFFLKRTWKFFAKKGSRKVLKTNYDFFPTLEGSAAALFFLDPDVRKAIRSRQHTHCVYHRPQVLLSHVRIGHLIRSIRQTTICPIDVHEKIQHMHNFDVCFLCILPISSFFSAIVWIVSLKSLIVWLFDDVKWTFRNVRSRHSRELFADPDY